MGVADVGGGEAFAFAMVDLHRDAQGLFEVPQRFFVVAQTGQGQADVVVDSTFGGSITGSAGDWQRLLQLNASVWRPPWK